MRSLPLPSLLAALALCACGPVSNSTTDGGSTTGTSDAGGGGPMNLPLDQAVANFSIVHNADDTTAKVTAHFLTASNQNLVLKAPQAVAVNNTALAGPDATGAYTATVPSADSYAIKVTEPSVGVGNGTIKAPAAFTITSPGDHGPASLSGFTTTWSKDTDASVVTRLELDQTFMGNKSYAKDLSSDPGTYSFSSDELNGMGHFVQGTDLNLTVTKVRLQMGASGGNPNLLFSSWTVEVDRSRTQALTPGP